MTWCRRRSRCDCNHRRRRRPRWHGRRRRRRPRPSTLRAPRRRTRGRPPPSRILDVDRPVGVDIGNARCGDRTQGRRGQRRRRSGGGQPHGTGAAGPRLHHRVGHERDADSPGQGRCICTRSEGEATDSQRSSVSRRSRLLLNQQNGSPPTTDPLISWCCLARTGPSRRPRTPDPRARICAIVARAGRTHRWKT